MSCLCQDRFKQTTADIVEEKPRVGGFFCHEVRLRIDSANAVGPAVWLGPTCIVRTTSRVGPPLKSLRRNRSRSGAGSRARGRPVSRPGGLLNLGTPCPDISPLGNLRGPVPKPAPPSARIAMTGTTDRLSDETISAAVPSCGLSWRSIPPIGGIHRMD